MKKEKEMISWSSTYKINHRAIKLIYGHYPKMVLSHFFSIIWTVLTPYIGIYLSALIIGELAGEKDTKRLTGLVCFTLITEAVIAFLSALLLKWKN